MADLVFPQFLESAELSADEAARLLIGCQIERIFDDNSRVRVRIVETEAYDQDDPASHTFHGISRRNRVMFGPSGFAYIYFTYGMHYCVNVVCGREGYGSGVLIRAAAPVSGEEIIRARRGRVDKQKGTLMPMQGVSITNGPAKLTKALGIDKEMYGHDFREKPLRLLYVEGENGALKNSERVVATPRIGISKAVERLRRFVLVGADGELNPYVSQPRFTRDYLV